jgi:acyl-CoA synthetase (AMP-forming)/AMP-acid ligase II
MVSHGNIIANTRSIIESLRLTSHDSVMAVLPFHYCFGTSLLHTHLHVGGSLVVDSRFMYVETILERLASTECTGFAGVPSHFQILLRSTGLRQHQFPRLRYVQQAGGHLPPAQVDELRAALPHTQVFVMYGQTEATARLSCLPPEFLDAKRGSIGRGIPGVRLRVVNASGDDVRPGEAGEITAEGDNVAKGYWGQPEESAMTFRQGTLYTGDLATIDEDGFIYIVGRSKDFLKCRGERVSCFSIEVRLLECEELSEAAVIGVPDDVLGEAVMAFVVPRGAGAPGLAARVHAFCKRRLPAHLVPREIVVLQVLPKNSAGKVMKHELKRASPANTGTTVDDQRVANES